MGDAALLLHEAERVAAARWAATDPDGDQGPGVSRRLAERRRRQAALLAQAEAVAAARAAAIDAGVVLPRPGGAARRRRATPVRRLVEDVPYGRPYRLADAAGRPVRCPRCGSDRRWLPVGDPEGHAARGFACEHGLPPEVGPAAALIPLDAAAACAPMDEEWRA